MRVLAGGEFGCAGGDCPTLYEAEDGSLYIQGYETTDVERAGLKMPAGETLVRITPLLLENIRKG